MLKRTKIIARILSCIISMAVFVCADLTAYAYDYPDVIHGDSWNDCSGATWHFYSTGNTYVVENAPYTACLVEGKIYDGDDENNMCDEEHPENQMPVSSFSHGYLEGWYYNNGSILCPCNPEYINNYVLTVRNGTVGGKMCATITEGDMVTVIADNAPENKMFDKWEITSGCVSIDSIMSDTDITCSTASISMPSENITINATYKETPLTYTSNPRNGSNVSSLSEIAIDFNKNICYLRYPGVNQNIDVKNASGAKVCDALFDYVDNSRADLLKVTLENPISEPGKYYVVIRKELLQDLDSNPYMDTDLTLNFTISSGDDKQDEADSQSDNNGDSNGKNDSYLEKLEQQFDEAIARGGKQIVYLNEGTVLSYRIMKKLRDNPNITLVFTYSYKNVKYRITLNGKNVKVYNNIPWYGPLYLYKHYGTTDSIISIE